MSSSRDDVVHHRDLDAAMPDGTLLRADAWTPGRRGRWPVLLQRLPYGRSVASTPVLPHPERLAERGYAVVVQDVRGRGGSQGRFEPFIDEGLDGATTIEWAARLPFSDGQVATYGFSYQGINQLVAAAQRPPSLRAIAPMMCGPEAYEGWTYHGGCLRWPFVTSWAAQLASQEPSATPVQADLNALPAADALGPDPPPWFREWLAHPHDDDYWQVRRPDLSAIEVPVFTVLGFFDDFAAGTAHLFEALGAEGVCGPWAHMPWGTRLGDTELGPTAGPGVAHDALVAFFDRVLKGDVLKGDVLKGDVLKGDVLKGDVLKGDARCAPDVKYFAGAAGWHTSAGWPPAATTQTWSCVSDGNANSRHGDGRLIPGPSVSELRDLFVSEPLAPFPGDMTPLSDESPAEDRRDVLCYTSAPLATPLTLAGSVAVAARIDADVSTYDLVVSVVIVGADRKARRLVTGARRLTTADAGAADVVAVDLGPMAWTVAPGERLRVDVSAARFPAFDRNPQSLTLPASLTPRSGCQVATIHLRQLRLALPIERAAGSDRLCSPADESGARHTSVRAP